MSKSIYEIAGEVNSLFNEKSVRGEAYPLTDNKLEVHIKGDWKHDHIYGKELLYNKYNCDIECIEVYDNESDWYEAMYHVQIKA